ncbi:MAG: DUF177 domain-containing protein [bacterium]
MRLDIGSLPEGTSHQDIEEDPSCLEINLEGGRLVSPLKISLDVVRTGDEIYVTGGASVKAVFECARCLDEYPCVIEGPIQMVVMIGDEASGSGGGEEGLVRVGRGAKSIDLTDAVRTELLVRAPLKPLCKSDCRGLCPTCGANFNKGACSCGTGDHDTRWDALKRFRIDG